MGLFRPDRPRRAGDRRGRRRRYRCGRRGRAGRRGCRGARHRHRRRCGRRCGRTHSDRRRQGGSCALDVGDRAAADAAAEQAAGLGGGALHILVNNAGVTAPAMFPKLTDETFRLTFDIHVMGTFHCTQAALPYIPTDGTGRVINVTSAAGLTGTLGQVNYSAAKAGMIGFTKSLARELASKNIMVNALAPLAATPMTETIRTNEKFAANMMARIPLKRWAGPDEVAGAFVFLASDAASYITGPGAAGRRRHGDVTCTPEPTPHPWPVSPSSPWNRPSPPRCARACSPTSVPASSRWRTPTAVTSPATTTTSSTGPAASPRTSCGATAARNRSRSTSKSPAGMEVLHRLLDRRRRVRVQPRARIDCAPGLSPARPRRAASQRHPRRDRRIRPRRADLPQARL